MKKASYAWLVLKALYEMARYDVIVSLRGSGYILRQLRGQSTTQKRSSTDREQAVCNAVHLATCFYWKPVLCLERAVCTTRLLRKHGLNARLAIGYRPSPFFSHAWVEIDGRTAYGSSAYQKRLQPLYVG